MIQFFRLGKSEDIDVDYQIISGKNARKFFIRRIIYLFLFIYSTLFLAVAIPFVNTPCVAIYFIGSFASAVYITRFANHILKYFKYKGGGISITSEFIEVRDSDKKSRIPLDEITYLEINFLGNLVIREKNFSTSFPRVLLKEEDMEQLSMLFEDISPKRSLIFRKIWEFSDAIVVALVLAVHIIQYVIQAYYIPTSSMEDTLKVGDHLFVEKITYGPIIPKMMGMDKPVHLDFLAIRSLKKGDIIIFTPPIESEKNKDYIKRCIALPGDEFHIKNSKVYINGKETKEPYTLGKPTNYDNFNITRNVSIEGKVPEGKVVVLGDNRTNSSDGRYFGYLDISSIKGRAFILYWNTSQIFKGDFSRIGLIR